MRPNNAEGYPLIYIDHDGNVLCNKCAQEGIDNDYLDPDATQGQVYWEGVTLHCDGCNAELESAYGDPYAQQE